MAQMDAEAGREGRQRPLIVSHRTNMKTDPENTIAGIRSAIARCVDAIEVDVQATSDGVPVLMHDCSMHRAVGDARSIEDVSADEARELRVLAPSSGGADEPVALLSEALEAAASHVLLVLDVKMTGIAEQVAKTIRQHAGNTRIHLDVDLDEVPQYRTLLPDVPITVGLRARMIQEHGLTALYDRCVELGVSGVSIRNPILDRCAVDEAHARGLFVKTWTIDRVKDMERVVATGVDSVCGNYPDEMRAVRERMAG